MGEGGMRIVGWHYDDFRTWGVAWLGILRFRAILKAPWNKPLFSERYGMTTTFRLGGGWRIQFRMVPKL
jgi:hypothetical protein